MASVTVAMAEPAGTSTSARDRAALGHAVYKKLAAPAFVVSFLSAIVPLLLNTHYYFVVTKFMHPKLTLAVAVIALHHVIGSKLKKRASGQSVGGSLPSLGGAVLLCAAGAAVLALLKPF